MRWEVLLGLAAALATAPAAGAGFADRGAADAGAPADTDAAEQPVHPYHTWETMTAELQQLVSDNPDIATLHRGGESVLGLELWVVEIADHAAEDRVPLDQRETIWLDGGTHADEQLGTELAMDWLEFLLEGYGDNETATWIVENRHTFVMPMVNPDGNHKDSRENARAVDLNRNYPVGWGALDEGRPPVGPGSYPLSEPETRTVVDWWGRTEPDYLNSFHTGIELMLYPWGYQEEPVPDRQVYRTICEEIGEADPEFCGPVHDVIYPAAGGSIDTSYARWGTVSFAYELSDEQGLYASVEDPRDRLQRYWDGVEHAFLNVEKYGAHPVVDRVALDGDTVELTLANEGYGNLTAGNVTVEVPGATNPTVALDRLPAGATTTVTAPVPADAADEGRLAATLSYAERVQASPTETRTVDLPAAVDGGEVAAAPLDAADATEGGALDVASADGADGVPAPGAGLGMLALAALAVLRRR